MTERAYSVLFLCTGNSARSILAEALLTSFGQGRFVAYSAGSMPKGAVNPGTFPMLERLGFSPARFRSKSWEEFAAPGAPQLDFVITVCDDAAGEVCPVWPGQPITGHWGIPDPAAVTGTATQIALAFAETSRQLRNRMELFLALPIATLERTSLQAQVGEIGKTADPVAQ